MLDKITLTHSDHPLLPFVRNNTVCVDAREQETVEELLTRVNIHPGSSNIVVFVDGIKIENIKNTIVKSGSIVQIFSAADGGHGGSTQVLAIVGIIALIAAGQYWGATLGNALLGADLGATVIGATTLGAVVGSAVINIGGMLILRALMPAPSAKLPTGASMSTASPTYSLTGGQNQARPFQPFMLVMGKHRVFPDISAKPTSYFSGNENYLHQVFNYGIVPLTWTGHMIGDTSVVNYSDITIVEGPNGASLPGIYQNTESQSGPNDLPFNNDDWSAYQYGAWTQRTTATDTTTILVNVGAICGLSLSTGPGHDMVVIEVQYSISGSGIWVASPPKGFASNKYEMKRGTVVLTVPKNQYDVRVRATSGGYDPSPHNPIQRTRTPYWFSMVSVQSEPASYTGQYRMGVKIRASGQLQGNLDRWSSTCLAECEVWNGVSWVVQHTRNPAWWFYNVAKGRTISSRVAYGAGLPDSRIDIDAIKAWGAWCDTQGLTFDAVIDSQISISDLLGRIAFAGMASPTWGSGKLGVVWQDRNDPAVAVFGMFNIIKGSFSVNYISENLADEIEATFIDADKDYQAQTIRVIVPGVVGTPQKTAKVDLFGITNSTNALRHARLQAAGQYYHRRRITWETDSEGLMVQRGKVVMLTHDLTQWDYSGRVIDWNAATKTLTLEKQVPRTSNDTIALRWPNGCVEYLSCVAGTGNSSEIVLISALPTISSIDGTALEAPGTSQPIHDWAWQFGPRATPGKRVRIVSMTPASSRTVKIEAVDEETGYYDYAGGSYSPPATFAIPNFTPSSLSVTETLLRISPTGSVCNIGLSWEGASAVTYVVRLRTTVTGIAGVIVGDWHDIGSATGNNFDFEANEGDYLEIEVSPFFDIKNKRGIYRKASTAYTVLGRTIVPASVSSISANLSNQTIFLEWSAIPDIDISTYDVKRGSITDTWETAILIGSIVGTRLQTPAVDIGTWRYFVKARDVLGLVSATDAYCDITISSPNNVSNISYSFYDTSLTSSTITLNWIDSTPDLGLKYYEVTYSSFTKTVIANTITLPANWMGNRTFIIKTVDNKGNKSSGISEVVSKLPPASVTGLTAQVIDNNVLLYWTIPAVTTLPLQDVIIKKGSTWETAAIIGTKNGEFTSLQELASGTYTYWVATRDTDNKQGIPVSVTAEVAQPPDFVFHKLWSSSFSGTFSNSILELNKVILPINTTETWSNHFINNSWTTPQAQIDAGYPIYIEPSSSSGYYEEIFDYGATLNSSKISVGISGLVVSGSPTITATISVSLDGVSYTDYVGFTSVYVTNFRYVKLRISVSSSGGDDIYSISGINITLYAKLKNDAGSALVSASDSGGTSINFNIPFLDITSLTATPQGTTLLTTVIDFTDTPNPTSFKVLLFDSSGSRASGTIYWNAKGY